VELAELEEPLLENLLTLIRRRLQAGITFGQAVGESAKEINAKLLGASSPPSEGVDPLPTSAALETESDQDGAQGVAANMPQEDAMSMMLSDFGQSGSMNFPSGSLETSWELLENGDMNPFNDLPNEGDGPHFL
jgi:hypothetical protein